MRTTKRNHERKLEDPWQIFRIMGELDEHKQPSRAWLERQDWGTPWTHHYVKDFGVTLLTFCQQFYFGE